MELANISRLVGRFARTWQRRRFTWSSRNTFAVVLIWLCFWNSREVWRGGSAEDRFYLIGAQGLGTPVFFSALSAQTLASRYAKTPYIGVLETDAWGHYLRNGALTPVAEFPQTRSSSPWFMSLLHWNPLEDGLMPGDSFTPETYMQRFKTLRASLAGSRDVLLYYGGIRRGPDSHGLNFNAWSLEQLRELRALGGHPFIGLETTDAHATEALIKKLQASGFGSHEPLYIRIASEPSGAGYGTEDGTAHGRRYTDACYRAYRARFTTAANQIRHLRERYGMNIKIVFAGTTREDFDRYMPPLDQFDDLGFDLYLTPANKERVLELLRKLSRRYPNKPLVIPELGIATRGPYESLWRRNEAQATLAWGQDALADLLVQLGRHPGQIRQITVFSVNVAGRMKERRWDWSWSPAMFEMLKEWRKSPRRWRKEGFHRYDPLTYPVDKDILYVNQPDLRIYCRRLKDPAHPTIIRFLENTYLRREGSWLRHTRIVTL
jgi:hypothetical protein